MSLHAHSSIHTSAWGLWGQGSHTLSSFRTTTSYRNLLDFLMREEASQRKAVWCPKAASGVWLPRVTQSTSLSAALTTSSEPSINYLAWLSVCFLTCKMQT